MNTLQESLTNKFNGYEKDLWVYLVLMPCHHALRYKNEPALVAGNKDQVSLGKFQFHFIRQTLVIGEVERRLSFRKSELLKLLY